MNHKTAPNAASTRSSAANTAQVLTAPAPGAGLRLEIQKVSCSISAAAAGADIPVICRVQNAEGSAYTYNNGTGVISAITFTKGTINSVDVGDVIADDGAATTYTKITAVNKTTGTITIASGLSATYNGGGFKIYKVVEDVIGNAAAVGEGIQMDVFLRTCLNGLAMLDIGAGGASCVTIANMPYRVI